MAVCQSADVLLKDCYRGQAPSHIDLGCLN